MKTFKVKNYKGNLVESLKKFSESHKDMKIVEACEEGDDLKIKAEADNDYKIATKKFTDKLTGVISQAMFQIMDGNIDLADTVEPALESLFEALAKIDNKQELKALYEKAIQSGEH